MSQPDVNDAIPTPQTTKSRPRDRHGSEIRDPIQRHPFKFRGTLTLTVALGETGRCGSQESRPNFQRLSSSNPAKIRTIARNIQFSERKSESISKPKKKSRSPIASPVSGLFRKAMRYGLYIVVDRKISTSRGQRKLGTEGVFVKKESSRTSPKMSHTPFRYFHLS